MAITKQQIAALAAGDVILLRVPQFGSCCMAVLERELSKIVLSVGADRVEGILPVCTPQYGYLTIDECGNICDQDGNNLTDTFLNGEILAGKAVDVAIEYRKRIMPDMTLLRRGKACFAIGPGRKEEVVRTILKIHNMVFNNDYKGNQAVAFEMFARLVKGAPIQELPAYLSALVNTMVALSQIQEVARSFEAEFSTNDITMGEEAQDLMDRMSGKKPS